MEPHPDTTKPFSTVLRHLKPWQVDGGCRLQGIPACEKGLKPRGEKHISKPEDHKYITSKFGFQILELKDPLTHPTVEAQIK